MLKLEGIHAYYGDSHVLQGISLFVGGDESVCLLGRNGAGKSTTIKSIMGFVPPREGEVHFKDMEITGLPPFAVVRKGIGYVPEDRRIFSDLTVVENLEVAFLKRKEGLVRWNIPAILEMFPLLQKFLDRKGGNLSGGEQQLLAIARALIGNPELLLLDEPCEGLAPVIVEHLKELILNLKKEIPILIAEQNAHFALEVSDRGYVIEKGLIKYEGMISDLMTNTEIQKRYLSV
jgi:branched-chain amino acid transport system ATP-binding protein